MNTFHIVEDILIQAGHARIRQEAADKHQELQNQNQTDIERLSATPKTTRKNDITIPYLLALNNTMPPNTDLVLRALQLLQDGRLTILIGSKSEASMGNNNNHQNGVSGFNSNSISSTSAATTTTTSKSTPSLTPTDIHAGPWLNEDTGLPASTYFSIASTWKGKAEHICLCPCLIRTDRLQPLCRVPWFLNSSCSCTCASYTSGLSSLQSNYCKHLLAVRLCALQGWSTLRVRHVTASQIGQWLSASFSSPSSTSEAY